MQEKKQYLPHVYDEDNVSYAVKRFVLAFNNFVEFYQRVPSKEIIKEKKLYNAWKKYSKLEKLSELDREYLQNHLIKIEEIYLQKQVGEEDLKYNIRQVVIEFVEEFNNFVEKYKRAPSYKKMEEKSLYHKMLKYTSIKYLNPIEKAYVEDNLNTSYLVRVALINFVKEFNDYFVEHKTVPPATTNLYQKWRFFRNPQNLNEAEMQYYVNNMAILPSISKDGVKSEIKEFVAKYNQFVELNKRAPTSSYANNDERKLYASKLYYVDDNNCSSKDAEYIKKNLQYAPLIKYYLVQFVEEYNEFVKTHNRCPSQFGSEKNDATLYQRWIHYCKHRTNLTDEEIVYLENNLIQIRKLRQYVVEFVNQYLAFKKEKGREPSSSLKVPTPERNLAISVHRYKYKLKLTEDEIEYLKEIGIDVRACRQTLQDKENKEIATV